MKYCTVCKAKFDDSVSFCPTDGEVLEDDPSSIVGTVLDGQYKIESLLGKGGMGAVYLARHILLGDRVAIKILPPEVRNNAEWLRRFRREGQAARRFRHANAVTVYDLRTAGDGTIYMVMEYVEGHTLDAELKERGRFTAAEAFEILEPIMSVLNTAHAMGVVHRDLKPENIMMGKATTGGESPIKLLDLGIAKMREIAGVESSGTTELTMAGQVLGTPYYMSPEQWGEISRDGNPEVDGRTDIYSLGLVAYQMISGRRPYSAVTLHELRREHISVSPPSLCEKVPDVPLGFSQAIDRAISKDRDDRQATAGELAAQLRAGLAEATGHAPAGRTFPDSPHPEPGSPAGQPGWGGGSSSAHMQGAPGALNTKSDVNAVTIVTVDAVPTTPPRMPQPGKPPPNAHGVAADPGQAQAPPAGAGVDDLGSSVTIQRAPKVAADLAGPKKSGGNPLVFVGAGVLLLVLAVIGVGGIFAVSWLKAKPGDNSTPPDNGKTATTKDVGRYWLEVLGKKKGDQAVRVAGAVPLVSGQKFRFHFQTSDNGYIYILGPGRENRPTVFLSAKPNPDSGLDNNQILAGTDFSFPAGAFSDGTPHSLTLDQKPSTEEYTVIFSTTPLAAPAFLNSEATGTPLNETEQAELNDFLARYKTSEPVTEINDKNAEAPFVIVKVPRPTESKDASRPVVFAVGIQHK
jgi:serine/threonine protein kinase